MKIRSQQILSLMLRQNVAATSVLKNKARNRQTTPLLDSTWRQSRIVTSYHETWENSLQDHFYFKYDSMLREDQTSLCTTSSGEQSGFPGDSMTLSS
ncbi:hypothetical protein OUZ56_004186 [Daphnia magna]|uniref:Uncharacterized protein n=1 Tax=Daphnia magna TaxID=35525 RepID=A0ABQ9YP72_9CRUS|nr:hypothetical protein OUZ56_004186 [Daphnia magna]